MSEDITYIGEKAVLSLFENTPNCKFRIHISKPNAKGTNEEVIKSHLEVKSTLEAQARFKEWAKGFLAYAQAPHKLFYLEIAEYSKVSGKPLRNGKTNIEITPFRLQPVPEEEKEESKGQDLSGIDINELVNTKVENARLQWELDQLRATQLEEEEDEDEEEDAGSLFGINLNSEIGDSIKDLIQGFATKLKTDPNSELIQALQTIKATNPNAEKVLIKLGQLAKEKPEEIAQMIEQLHTNLFPPPKP